MPSIPLPGATRAPVRYAARDAWLQARRSGLGASEVAAVVGASADKSEWDVLEAKTVEPETRRRSIPMSVLARMERGNREEPRILEDYAYETGDLAVQVGLTIVPGAAPLAVTPDAFIFDHALAQWGGGEVKTDVSPFRWGASGVVFERFDPAMFESVREDYVAQCYACLAATGLPWWRLIVRRSLDDLRWYTIVADEAFQAGLVAECQEWWQRHIVDDEPLAPDASDACARCLARMFPNEVKRVRAATAEERAMAEELDAVRARLREDDRRRRELSNALVASMGEFARVTWPGEKGRENYARTQDTAGDARAVHVRLS